MGAESQTGVSRDVAMSFLRAWIQGVLCQATRYREALGRLIDVEGRYEDDMTVEEDLVLAADQVMVEQHQLVNAAYQLDLWGKLSTREDAVDRPQSIKLLDSLRGSVEHLYQAELTFAEARKSSGAYSIKKLPRKRLSLGIALSADDPKLYGLVSVNEIEQTSVEWAQVVQSYLDHEIEDQADAAGQLQTDMLRGK